MPIQFMCPNGHPLSAPSKHAGRPGRCPTCDVAYVTPEADRSVASTAKEKASETGSPQENTETGEEAFQFLCPNGHKINTPASLAGQLGQCPRCGERFHIPDTGQPIEQDGEESEGAAEVDGQLVEGEEVIPLAALRPGWRVPASALSGEQTMAEVTSWIWEEKGQEHQVEITLRDGSTLRPSSYAAGLKSQDVGIFGTPNDQGGLTLRALAWDAIALVSVLNLTDEIDELVS